MQNTVCAAEKEQNFLDSISSVTANIRADTPQDERERSIKCKRFVPAIRPGIVASMMILYDTLVILLYKIIRKIYFVDTPLVLTIPYFISIFGVFLMRRFFMICGTTIRRRRG